MNNVPHSGRSFLHGLYWICRFLVLFCCSEKFEPQINRFKIMKTFLFVHNPEKWRWESLHNALEDITEKGSHFEKWSVRSYKQVSVGDRAFLMRLGSKTQNKGIVGSGYIATAPFLSEHWSNNGQMVNRVIIEFDELSKEPIVSLQELQELSSNYNWIPRSSGIEIPKGAASNLEELWFEKTLKRPSDRINANFCKEGAVKSAISKRYERNPQARSLCLESNGYSCKVCGFNFRDTYGELGQGYIHVHHIIPISAIGEEYEINPEIDLVPICPNCHAMIHKATPSLQIDELQKLMGIQKKYLSKLEKQP